jgi:hypothetical protein
MERKNLPERVLRIYRRTDGKYESRNDVPGDSPLGVDYSLNQALGTAQREATLASSKGCRVRIEIQDRNNEWKPIDVVEPPRT